jgi:putative endonuclease
MSDQFFVYVLASHKHGTLYMGVTNDLIRRVHQHKLKVVRGFTKRYDVHKLVAAITREKQLKKWNREWKIQLIERENPEWIDLSHTLF